MKHNIDSLKKSSLANVHLSTKMKDSAINTDLNDLIRKTKTLARTKNVIVLVIESD